jgi:molybdopterin-synthase adenylyltransferase
MTGRYSRQVALFGTAGQERLQAARVVLVGLGGLGSHLAQQLAYLGIGRYALVDHDRVSESNLNRLIGATAADIGTPKTVVARRLIQAALPSAEVDVIQHAVPHDDVTAAIGSHDAVLAGLDRETPRLALTEACSRLGVPYLDLASDVDDRLTPIVYGGRVVVAGPTPGCLSCLGLLDQEELAWEAMSSTQKHVHRTIYGVNRETLHRTGPSVVTINGVVGSLAATELMCLITGLRRPAKYLEYRGNRGLVFQPAVDAPSQCPYCSQWASRPAPSAADHR